MKRKLIAALACSLSPVIMASDVGLTSTSLFSAISVECTKKHQANFVFSPYSILGVFHMAQLGAEGETKKQMDALVPHDESFKLPSFDVPSIDGSEVVHVETANRIYAHKALEGNEYFANFDKEVRLAMGSDAKTVDFAQSEEAAREINEFVDKKTRGHIKRLVESSSLSGMTRMVLINALYFKAPWNSKFERAATTEGVFHARTPSGLEVQRVKFMRQSLERGFTYLRENDLTAFSVNYADYRLRLFVYLPDNMDVFEAKIAEEPQRLEELAGRLKNAFLFEHELELTLPKFKLAAEENRLDLIDLFKGLGADLMFDWRRADFSGMTGTRDLFVSTFAHQADITVDEDGTEATAATAIGIMAMSLPMPKTPLPVVVNRPFLFQIRFEEEGSSPYVLLAGRIADAKAAQ